MNLSARNEQGFRPIFTAAAPVAANTASAETQSAERAQDERKIRKLFDDLGKAWEKGDAAAYATAFTDDSDYVTFAGERIRGQIENAELHDALFSSVLKGTRLVGDLESIRFLADDVAVVHGTGAVLMPWQREVHPARRSIQAWVLVRRHGAWQITAFQNTRIRPLPTTGPIPWLFTQYLRARRALHSATSAISAISAGRGARSSRP